jgi:hypothetical protein
MSSAADGDGFVNLMDVVDVDDDDGVIFVNNGGGGGPVDAGALFAQARANANKASTTNVDVDADAMYAQAVSNQTCNMDEETNAAATAAAAISGDAALTDATPMRHIVVGEEFTCAPALPPLLHHSLRQSFDFIVVPLMHPRYRRRVGAAGVAAAAAAGDFGGNGDDGEQATRSDRLFGRCVVLTVAM